MEWFFTLNDDPNFFKLAQVAVVTARKNTKLQPVCMYSGDSPEIMNWLDKYGVKVIRHRASLEEFALDLYRNDKIKKKTEVASYFIRVDMPLYCPDDTFLYADADVMFLGDCAELGTTIRPKVLAAAPQENPWEFEEYFNNGVMVCNGKALKDTYDDFVKFILDNQTPQWLYEQESYNRYYHKMSEELPLEYNWKAYWEKDRAFWYNGVAPRTRPIQILHFHGPKPYSTEKEGLRNYRNKWFTYFSGLWHETYLSEFGPTPTV